MDHHGSDERYAAAASAAAGAGGAKYGATDPLAKDAAAADDDYVKHVSSFGLGWGGERGAGAALAWQMDSLPPLFTPLAELGGQHCAILLS